MKIDVVERFSVASFLDDGANASVSRNRISNWLLVDMNLRGKAGLATDENSLAMINSTSVPNVLIVGTESGRILYFSLPTSTHSSVATEDEILQTNTGLTADSAVGAVPNFRSIRPVEISIPSIACHSAQISALMVLWQTNPAPAATSFGARHPQDTMLIFSGSLDRTIKIWNFSDLSNSTSGGSAVGSSGSSTGQTNVLAQTLCGHAGAVTQIVDGSRDGQGSILSSSMDGSIRVWVAQKGRSFIHNPYYECAFIFKATEREWLTGLVISNIGPWVCYAGDSLGNVKILRKATEISGEKTKQSNSVHAIAKADSWEKLHRLGITHISLQRDEHLLITLSMDGTCKINDPAIGHTLFTITNTNKCQFTGVTWIKDASSFYLVDEMGKVDIFSHFHEKIVDSAPLVALTSTNKHNILKSHTGQLALGLTHFHQKGYFLTLTESLVDEQTRRGGSSAIAKAAAAAVRVVGDLCLWCISRDANCSRFLGHLGGVLAISVPTFLQRQDTTEHGFDLTIPQRQQRGQTGINATASAVGLRLRTLKGEKNRPGKSSFSETLQVSEAENLFFSISQDDGTIRCWDEYDQSENYQFRVKGSSEIMVMLCLWEINRIVTGHDNGMVCLWNADTGNKVVSKELRSTVSSLVEAKNLHSRILIGSDYNGKIAIWNLTLHMLNPMNLVTETVFQGFHDRDDPGVLCLAFHFPTNTVFSGGNDRTIRYWKLHQHTASKISDPRMETICFLKCTSSFICAGDDSGNLNLYQLIIHLPSYGAGQISHTPMITDVIQMCSWSCLYPTRSIADIVELSSSRAFVVQVGGAGNGRTKIWEVNFTKLAASARNSNHKKVLDDDMSSMNNINELLDEGNENQDISTYSAAERSNKTAPASSLNSFCEILDSNFSGSHKILLKEIYSVNPENFEISCCNLSCHSARNIKGFLTEHFNLSLYLGSINGPILKFTFTNNLT